MTNYPVIDEDLDLLNKYIMKYSKIQYIFFYAKNILNDIINV